MRPGLRQVWNSAWAPDLGSLALEEKKVFCDYLAAAGSHTQKAGLAMVSYLSPAQHLALFTTPPPSSLGLWCQAHVTVFMLCNELLNAFPTFRDPFDGGHVAIRQTNYQFCVFVSGWAGVGVCAWELAYQ